MFRYSEVAVAGSHSSEITHGRKELPVSYTAETRKCNKDTGGILIGF